MAIKTDEEPLLWYYSIIPLGVARSEAVAPAELKRSCLAKSDWTMLGVAPSKILAFAVMIILY